MSIVVNPIIRPDAVQGVSAPVVLPPGTVISARVQQVLGQVLGVDTVRIAIGGQSIDVASQVPLQAGQTLQLAVSQAPDGTIRLAVVDPQGAAAAAAQAAGDLAGAAADSVTLAPDAVASIAAQITSAVNAPTNQLTALEALAVSVAAQSAATQQTGLAPLFANLSVAAGLDGLPAPVQQAVAQLLAQRTSLDPGLTGNDIQQAFQNSGLFLEASLASGSLSPTSSTPDLKAALIVLRQVLTTSLNDIALIPGATMAPSSLAIPNALATLRALATPGVLVAASTPAPVAIVPQGATPGAPAAAIVPQAATSPTPVVQPATTPAAAIALAQATQEGIDALTQPFTLMFGAETPTTVSPALAPLLAPEIAAASVLIPTAAPPAPQVVPSLGAANPVIATASPPADAARAAASGAALNLLQEALQAVPLTAANPSGLLFDNNQMVSLLPALTGTRLLKIDDAEFARSNVPPPPISGAVPAAQPVMAAKLVSNSSSETAMHHLLADTEGAIARQTLLQVASLPDRVDTATGRVDHAGPRWNFEIPFATAQGTAMAQFEISRDGGGNEVEAAKRVWRARFSLDVEPAGPVHALISLSGERTSVRMWAERPATAAQLRAGAAELSQALSQAELHPGDIVIQDGTPPAPAPARAGHFLDRAL
jgi:Flagellar hook-length control protein FliK